MDSNGAAWLALPDLLNSSSIFSMFHFNSLLNHHFQICTIILSFCELAQFYYSFLFVHQVNNYHKYFISGQLKLNNGFQKFPPVFNIQDLEVRDYQNGDLSPGD